MGHPWAEPDSTRERSKDLRRTTRSRHTEKFQVNRYARAHVCSSASTSSRVFAELHSGVDSALTMCYSADSNRQERPEAI